MSRLERFFSDKFAILTFIIIIAFFSLLYVAFQQTQLYDTIKMVIGPLLEVIWTALIVIANLLTSFFKNFRNKVLFRNSKPKVKANKGPKVLLWILDGCSVQAILDVTKRNRDLKTFYEEGYFARCVTIFPSITPAAHSTILTGCYPFKTRVPGFDWVEVKTDYAGNESREYIRCMPDFKRFLKEASTKKYQEEFFKGLGDALDLNQRLLNPTVYTVFETLGEDWYTVSIKEWIHRGADNFIGESINAILGELVSKNVTNQRSMIALLNALYKEVNYEFGDLLWGSETYQSLADLMVYWKTGTDTVSHEYGPGSYQVREEVDESIGKLVETLMFYKMHTNQPIYVIITSDHSQSEVTEFSNLITDFKTNMSDKFLIASREDRTDTFLLNKADIIVSNNDRAAFFYIFGEKQIKTQTRAEVIEYLKHRREVDLILYMENGKTKVIQPLEDGAFMGPQDIHTFFKNKEKDYPNAVERIEGLMKGDNFGEVVISLKEGYSLNPDFKPEREGEEFLHGDHGGLNFNDSVGPLLIWGPTIRSNEKNGKWKTLRTIDITSIIFGIFNLKQKSADSFAPEEIFTTIS